MKILRCLVTFQSPPHYQLITQNSRQIMICLTFESAAIALQLSCAYSLHACPNKKVKFFCCIKEIPRGQKWIDGVMKLIFLVCEGSAVAGGPFFPSPDKWWWAPPVKWQIFDFYLTKKLKSCVWLSRYCISTVISTVLLFQYLPF